MTLVADREPGETSCPDCVFSLEWGHWQECPTWKAAFVDITGRQRAEQKAYVARDLTGMVRVAA